MLFAAYTGISILNGALGAKTWVIPMRNKRGLTALRRWGGKALTLLFACALMAGLSITALALETWQGEVVSPVIPKPIVTIQGNLVVDENKQPTGFYELALCVKSGYDYRMANPAYDGSDLSVEPYLYLTQEEYAKQLALDPTIADKCEIHYYPFRSVTASVNINTDVLTAVNWDIQNVTYETIDSNTGFYSAYNTSYPWGINTDPAFQGYTMPRETAFPNITTPDLYTKERSVALDVEGDSRMATAEGVVEHFDPATKAALVTLSANAPDNYPVVLEDSTILVVARFSYDLKRFSTTKVNDTLTGTAQERNSVTGDPTEDAGFWMGWDKTTGLADSNSWKGKEPLTWMGESMDNSTTGGKMYDFQKSDYLDSRTQSNQAVWVHMGTDQENVTSQTTYFYYYLAAETDANFKVDDVDVVDNGVVTNVPGIALPDTKGERVLTVGDTNNPEPDPAEPGATKANYTFFENLLKLADKTLALELVNAETFKKPTGGFGGNQILFYDWDDTLIGALIVGDGDVRSEVNAYVEQNLVHPDLRASDLLADDLGGQMPDFSDPSALSPDEQEYQNLITSLNREYTYRGKYSSTPDGNGIVYPEDGTDMAGSNYPLTNKLDYAFYRHLNTVTTVETENAATGKKWTENYFTVNDLTEDELAAQYPWTYGWAIVEDPANTMRPLKEDWPVMVDSVKLENTWTTFGVGELENMDPSNDNNLSGFVASAGTTTPAVSYPGGLTTDWSADVDHQTPNNYAYKTSTAGVNGYLRFADFSNMSKMLENGQNVLIVKAVYEPGTSLSLVGNYSVVEDSLRVYRLGTPASSENSIYAFEYQYQRANSTTGQLIGVGRAREPAIRTGFVFDAKSVDTTENLEDQNTFFLKNVANNTDIMDIQLTTGGSLWKLEYTLLDIYNLDISNGVTRSNGGEWNLKTGFEYEKPDGSGEEWDYDDRQGTDGFVTQATLNTLLIEATKEARESGTGKLSGHTTLRTIQDLNFKKNSKGDSFTAIYVPDFIDYFQNLVTRLYNSGNPDYLDKDGNVVLGWHQIQQHIIMCAAGNPDGIYTGGVLKSEAECIAIGFEWCRLDTCGTNVTMSINSFQDVLKALDIISTGTGDTQPAQKALYGEDGNSGITGAELLAYGFRRHAEGVPYSGTDAEVKTAILADLQEVVNRLKAAGLNDWASATWDRVQLEIVRIRMQDSTISTLNAWWKPTAYKAPTISSWSDWLKYSYQAYVGVDTTGDGQPDAVVPDAFDGYKNVTKTLLDAMIKEHVHGNADGEYADMGWLRAGVDDNGECVEFTDVEQFAAAWKKAVEALSTPYASGGGGYVTVDLLKTARWEEIQYAVMTGTYKSYADIMAGIADGTLKSMYWNDGGQPVLTFERLLDAINKAFYQGNHDDLNRLLAKGIDPINNEVYLRKADGAAFTSQAEFEQAITNVIDALNLNTVNGRDFRRSDGSGLDVDIYELQYLIINYSSLYGAVQIPRSAEIQANSDLNNYWWFDGGSPSGPMPIRDIRELFTAYFWYTGSGVSGTNPDAMSDLTAAILTSLQLYADDWGIPFNSSMTNGELVQIISDAMDLLPYSAATLSSATDANLLKELQYAILYGEYRAASSISENFWWQGGSYPAINNQASLLENAYKAYVGNDNNETLHEAGVALGNITSDFINERTKKGVVGLAMRYSAKGDNFPSNINVFLGKLQTVVETLHDTYGLEYADMASVTQYQLQYFLLNTGVDWSGSDSTGLMTDAEIQAAIDPNDYWWFTSDTDPNASGPTLKEKEIDTDQFKAFLEAIALYTWWGEPETLEEYTVNHLTDFNLRKDADGTEFSDFGEFVDGSAWDDLASIVYYALQEEFYDGTDDEYLYLLRTPSWQEVQYIIIHGTYDGYEAALNEAENPDDGYTWGYEMQDAPPPAGRSEKKIDENEFKTFLEAIALYTWWGEPDTIEAYTVQHLTDFNLRKDADGTEFASFDEFVDGSAWDDISSVIYYALQEEYFDPTDDEYLYLLSTPDWTQVQYIIIHGTYADYETARSEAEDENTGYTWGWTDG